MEEFLTRKRYPAMIGNPKEVYDNILTTIKPQFPKGNWCGFRFESSVMDSDLCPVTFNAAALNCPAVPHRLRRLTPRR